jgi:hypothetical protein
VPGGAPIVASVTARRDDGGAAAALAAFPRAASATLPFPSPAGVCSRGYMIQRSSLSIRRV